MTADEKRGPFMKYTQQDLEGLRKSVQTHQTSQLQEGKRPLLDAWSNFHKEVEPEEGEFHDEPELMNGQSHRAHLHFEMRSKEGPLFARNVPNRPTPTESRKHMDPALDTSGSFNQPVPTGPRKHLDPALSHAKFSVAKPKHLDPALGPPRPAKLNTGIKHLKLKRRPILSSRSPARDTASYEGKLTDPGSWLDSVRNKATQPDTSPQPHTTPEVGTDSDVKLAKENPSIPTVKTATTNLLATTTAAATKSMETLHPVATVKPAATTTTVAATKSAEPTQPIATTKPVAGIQLAVAPQQGVSTNSAAIIQPAITAKPVADAHVAAMKQPVVSTPPAEKKKPVAIGDNPFLASNLPRPPVCSRDFRNQPQLSKGEGFLLDLDSPPKKVEQEQPKAVTGPDVMDLDTDGDEDDADIAESIFQDNTLNWIEELGIINDKLAELDLAKAQIIKLEDRRRKLQGLIHAASAKKSGRSRQSPKRHERLISLSPSPLEKPVRSQLFVPIPQPLFSKPAVPLTGGLESSRWATANNETPIASKVQPSKPTNDSNDESVDYWQKALPKIRPLAAEHKTKSDSAPQTPKKGTMPMFESRYAC
ncbi:hypothetical protein TSTA_071520 [Talaromyces stipitatus ATCC 10500]|uniref:Uncharacterized protein n=1 Tax=Talaromyces stipitatus (strain ATCC 10500 / CBS 375.48 / QM 6759 / NRRL 1006) TaxID=441959 RepID=B8LUI2_TALSN|nr:uncharacterized protein TSTA_071520 [Talaromyces stipitatus ATCC 10500]EED23755.1 hypothetical protein TSTA_071520 [Talaromyces stipitatus ATCC 10500]